MSPTRSAPWWAVCGCRPRGRSRSRDDGLYRVFAGETPRDFPDLDAATDHARRLLEVRARRDAIDAGAGEVNLTFERRDRVAVVEGRETLVESTVVAVASGRPRFAG